MTVLRGHLSRNSAMLRHALRTSIATAAAVLLTKSLHLHRGYWTTLTCLVILQPYGSQTTAKALQRVVGTVVGAGVAIAVATWIHDPLQILGCVFLFIAVGVALMPLNYGLFAVFLTPTFVLLAERSSGEPGLASLRVVNTLLGAGMALAGARLLFPLSERDHIRPQIAAALRALRELLVVVASHGASAPDAALKAARRNAGLALSNADASFQRLLTESQPGAQENEALLTLLLYGHRIASVLIALSRGAPDAGAPGDETRAPRRARQSRARSARSSRGDRRGGARRPGRRDRRRARAARAPGDGQPPRVPRERSLRGARRGESLAFGAECAIAYENENMRGLSRIGTMLGLLASLAGCSKNDGTHVTLPSFADVSQAPAVIQKAARAVVRIGVTGELATGSFISPSGLLLTNDHVLGVDICPLEGCFAQITQMHQKNALPQDPRTVFVVPQAVDVGLDMAVVQVFSGSDASSAPLDTPDYLTIDSHDPTSLQGEHVHVVGHPEGNLKKWSQGEVVDSDGSWVYTTAYILPGNSGSPLLDDEGRLVGLMHRGPTEQTIS